LLIDGPPVRTREPAPGPTKKPDPQVRIVSEYIAPTPGRHVPQMLLATTLVAVLPLVSSLVLRATGVISGWASVGLAVALSLATSTAGSAFWRKRGGHGEVLFSELLLWGWLRSWRQERELANATRLLDLVNPGGARADARDDLSTERREHLLRQLATALEAQDVYLNGHSRRVARHATMIARGMGLSSQDVARIRAAAAVHDIGKLLTPKAIINKPGRLTDAEFEVVKRHPVDGAEMVAALGDPELTRIVRHHHERLDGAGYPDRLSGEAIPLGARIIAVADTFDAITSARPYRDAAPHQKAIDILREEAGAQLDPDAVKAFLAYYSGSRPTVVWAIVTSSIRRVVAWLSGDPAAAATISASKVAAATVATATIGAVASAAPVPVVHHAQRPAVVYRVTLPRRGVAAGLARPGGTATLTAPVSAPPTGAAAAKRATVAKPASAPRRRSRSHAVAAKRSARPAGGNTAHQPAAGASAGATIALGTPSGSSTNATAPSTASAAVTSGAAKPSGTGAATSPAPQPAVVSQRPAPSPPPAAPPRPTPPNPTPPPAAPPRPTPPNPTPPNPTPPGPTPPGHPALAPVPTGPPSNQGNQAGNSDGSHANGNGNRNPAASPSAVVIPTPPSSIPAPPSAPGDQGKGGGSGHGGSGHGG
jgi:putative nucleotidyltransferase with HDIG domain